MSEYRLDELCEILDSKRVPLSAMQRAKRHGPYPYYGAQSVIDYVDDYLLDGEYLLVAEDGANLVTRTQDIANLVNGKIWVNNHAHILKAKSNFTNNNFLLLCLNNTDYTHFVSGSTRLKLTQTLMKKIPIPLPPKDEQERIVKKIDELFEILEVIENSL